MKFLSSSKKNQKGQGLVEYALILVLVAIVVIAALMILGPIIGNVFSKVNSSLTTVSAGGGSASTPVPAPVTLNYTCPSSGMVDVKNMSGGPNGASFGCSSGTSLTYTVTGQTSGSIIQLRNMYPPYNVLGNVTVP